MTVIGVIPARFAATRLPGKLMRLVAGKPLIQWVIEAAKTSDLLDQVIVATDHQEIHELALSLGVQAVMTPSNLPSGSDRVWAAVKNKKADVVLNIQGDEPLITGHLIDQLIKPMLNEKHLEMGTLARKIKPEEIEKQSVVKIVCNKNNEALYFSRFPIPYSRETIKEVESANLKHIGMYAYRSSFLQTFCETEPSKLELAEGLEQLRALYLGAKIKVVEVVHESWGVDVEEDINQVEKILKNK